MPTHRDTQRSDLHLALPIAPSPRWGEKPRRVRLKSHWFAAHGDPQHLHSILAAGLHWGEDERAIYIGWGTCTLAENTSGVILPEGRTTGRTLCPRCLWSGDFYFVYHLSGPEGLVYIGCTRQFRDRLIAHRRTANWWHRVDAYLCDIYPTPGAGSWAEAEAIRRLRPPANGSTGVPYRGVAADAANATAPIARIDGSVADLVAHKPQR